ncbi:DinB family protein [Alienimonas californiensis]|uniref:DinB superfamily protein n=1 Tax=Alienimonas californiensis TaxID=2527989 RepID=A0A517P5W6_9PLAN|nr:DinB family protein [Alienimonas californiensis]QDT14745.1 DinB superfamily protein [Alienimonas californiensis]
MTPVGEAHAALAERLAAELTGFCVAKLRDQAAQIDRCVRLLSEEQVWERANDVSNSIGNLVLHLTGNVRQWAGEGLGGVAFDRDRPAEFARRDPLPADELLSGLHAAIDAACTALERLSPAELAAERTIQGRQISGVAAAVHVTEHFTGHVAQIVVYTKLLTGQDLSLYDDQGRRLDAAARL